MVTHPKKARLRPQPLPQRSTWHTPRRNIANVTFDKNSHVRCRATGKVVDGLRGVARIEREDEEEVQRADGGLQQAQDQPANRTRWLSDERDPYTGPASRLPPPKTLITESAPRSRSGHWDCKFVSLISVQVCKFNCIRMQNLQVCPQCKFDPNCISKQSAIKVTSASSRNSADVISDSTNYRLHIMKSQYGFVNYTGV